MSTVALLYGAAAGTTVGVALSYAMARWAFRPAAFSTNSPPCDRCDKPTGRPYLWTNTRLPWHCADCKRWINSQLFQAPDTPGYDRAQHMAFLGAWRDLQASWHRAASGEQPGPRSHT